MDVTQTAVERIRELVASGTLVPLLLRQGLTQTWCGLGALSLFLTIIAWAGWPGNNPAPQEQSMIRTPEALIPYILAIAVVLGLAMLFVLRSTRSILKIFRYTLPLSLIGLLAFAVGVLIHSAGTLHANRGWHLG